MSLDSFLDELEKIAAAVTLSPEEKRKQMFQFTGLGAVMVPTLSSAVSKMQTGKWIPSSAKSPKRWLGGALAQGLFWGGMLPTMQHAIARSNVDKAKARVAATKELQQLAPSGVHQVLKPLPATDPTLMGVK